MNDSTADIQVRHISFSDIVGGANMSSYRLHRGLVELGVDSKMLVSRKRSDDPSVIHVEKGVQRALSLLRIYSAQALLRCGFPDAPAHSLNLLPSFLGKRIALPSTGITHLHWVHGEMMSISEIPRLPGIPVWTLHDGWALGGSKHFALKENLSYFGRLLDSSIRNRKKRHWANWNVQLIAMCEEMRREAEAHPVLGRLPCEVLPNSVDSREFFRVENAREALGIGADERVVLFVYAGKLFERVKGFDVVEHTLRSVKSSGNEKLTLVVIGGPAGPEENHSWGRLLRPGYVCDPKRMREWYSAADLFLAPSRYEPFGNAVIEAAACGLPCIAFRLGGPADTIDNNVSGILVDPEDVTAYAEAAQSLLRQDEKRTSMGVAARERVRRLYSRDVVAARHLKLYRRLIDARTPR